MVTGTSGGRDLKLLSKEQSRTDYALGLDLTAGRGHPPVARVTTAAGPTTAWDSGCCIQSCSALTGGREGAPAAVSIPPSMRAV